MSRACSTARGSCDPNHSPRRGLDGYCTPFCEPCVCSTAPIVSGYCSPIHLLHRGPRASVDAPAPSGLRGLHRAPRSGPYEDRPPTCDLVHPRFKRSLATGPPDERILYDYSSYLASNSSSSFGLRADFVASLQAAYRTLDMRRVPRVQPLQFPSSADRTAATQMLIRSIRNALSGIFGVANPTGTVTLTSPVWVPEWHAPLLKLTKAAKTPNRDDTHDIHCLVDDLFSQLQERMTSGSSGPAAFKTLLADFADYFDRAPRGAVLATL